MTASITPYAALKNKTEQGDEDDPETGVQSSFSLDRPSAPRSLTLFQLREMFPFEGTFHFRLKVWCARGVWGGVNRCCCINVYSLLWFDPW